jgi:hypothetical protein
MPFLNVDGTSCWLALDICIVVNDDGVIAAGQAIESSS